VLSAVMSAACARWMSVSPVGEPLSPPPLQAVSSREVKAKGADRTREERTSRFFIKKILASDGEDSVDLR